MDDIDGQHDLASAVTLDLICPSSIPYAHASHAFASAWIPQQVTVLDAVLTSLHGQINNLRALNAVWE